MTTDISQSLGHDVPPGQFRPVQPSLASRKIPKKSRFSSRGSAPFGRRKIQFESGYERGCLVLAMLHPDVVDILDQSPRVEYRDAEGRRRRHTFDYLITLKSGRRIAVAVKPAALAKARHLADELKLVRAAIPRAHIDQVVLATEKQINKNDVLNAMRIMTFRRDNDPEADQVVYDLTRKLVEPTMVGVLIRQSKLAGRAYRAIGRAVARGTLRIPQRMLFDYETPITAGGAS